MINIMTLAIILYYINIPKYHTVHLKLIQCYVSNLFKNKKENSLQFREGPSIMVRRVLNCSFYNSITLSLAQQTYLF